MFKQLSKEETRSVKRWQAPELKSGITLPFANVEQTLRRLEIANAGLVGGSANDETATESTLFTLQAQRDSSAHIHDSISATEQTTAVSADVQNNRQAELGSHYDEGYSLGFAEGNIKARESLTGLISTVTDTLAQQVTLRNENLKSELIALARAMAEMILQRELAASDDAMLAVVERAISRLPSATLPTTILVNPLDGNNLRTLLADQNVLTIVDDSALARGDCIVRQKNSQIDTGMSALLANITTATP